MSAQMVGTVPVWQAADGRTYVADDDVGRLFEPGERRMIRQGAGGGQIGRRTVQLEAANRRDDRRGGGKVAFSPEQAYQQAIASGMVNENQYEGLGYGALAGTAGATLTLTNTVNRSIWIKSFVAQGIYSTSYTAGSYYGAVVTDITIAGIPVNIGSAGAPIATFAHDATRFGMSFGRKLAAVGQQVSMSFENQVAVASSISATAIGDELNPFVQQQVMQMQLLTAAASGFSGFGG